MVVHKSSFCNINGVEELKRMEYLGFVLYMVYYM